MFSPHSLDFTGVRDTSALKTLVTVQISSLQLFLSMDLKSQGLVAQEMHRWILGKSPVLNLSVSVFEVTLFHVPEADALNIALYLSLIQLDNNTCVREVKFFPFSRFHLNFQWGSMMSENCYCYCVCSAV